MSVFWILISLAVIAWLCGVICALTDGEVFGKAFHKMLGWHWPDLEEPIEIQGTIITAHCKFCGKEIQQDSQGNWY